MYATHVISFTRLSRFSHATLKSWEEPGYKARIEREERERGREGERERERGGGWWEREVSIRKHNLKTEPKELLKLR